MFRLSVRDLQFRALRFAITALATAVVFSIVLVMAGLSTQFHTETKEAIEKFGGDAWVVEDGDAGPFTGVFSIPTSFAAELDALDATEASPLVLTLLTLDLDRADQIARVVGADPDGLGFPEVTAGRTIEGPDEVVVASSSAVAIGDDVVITGTEFEVVGLVEGMTMAGGIPVLFIDLAESQDLFFSGEPIASALIVQGEIPPLPPGYKAMSLAQTREDTLRPLNPTMTSLDYMTILLWIAGTALMGAVVYVSAIERLRDFAVVKALGGSTGRLLGGVVLQSVLVAILAAAAGVGLSFVVTPNFPFLIKIPQIAYVQLFALAVGAGVFASMGGVRRAVKVDPVMAFSAAGR